MEREEEKGEREKPAGPAVAQAFMFKDMNTRKQYECPTEPKEGTEFHYYTKVEQSDLVPVLAELMGMPISKNSLGVFISELTGILRGQQVLRHYSGRHHICNHPVFHPLFQAHLRLDLHMFFPKSSLWMRAGAPRDR